VPFTPFHLGAALALKPVLRQHFSVLAFGVTQVAMDVEPLVGMINDWDTLHGWTHTLGGALLIAAAVAVATPLGALSRFLQRKADENRLGWLMDVGSPSRRAAWLGALVGSFSHLALDALIHHDMHPLLPFSRANPLLGRMGHDDVYLLCAVAALAGAAAWVALRWPGRARRLR